MIEGNALLVVVGSLLGVLLLGIGIVIGYRLNERRRGEENGFTEGDRERMLHLLAELSEWTSEYSGNVSDYQHKLGEIRDAVRQSAGASKRDDRAVTLLQQIMDSNEHLQLRLEAAELQLDKQKEQIESYLTEARTDPLTGLYNRRAFDQQIESLFAAYRKGGRPFALAIVDIDHFKSINDSHGHQVGDDVLKHVASVFRRELPRAIMVARFGGEEFAIVVDGPLRHAAESLNGLRRAIASERFEAGSRQLDVTVSIGLSEPRDDLVIAPVIRRADESLYAAKNIGRNRVYFHDGRGPTLVGAPEVAR